MASSFAPSIQTLETFDSFPPSIRNHLVETLELSPDGEGQVRDSPLRDEFIKLIFCLSLNPFVVNEKYFSTKPDDVSLVDALNGHHIGGLYHREGVSVIELCNRYEICPSIATTFIAVFDELWPHVILAYHRCLLFDMWITPKDVFYAMVETFQNENTRVSASDAAPSHYEHVPTLYELFNENTVNIALHQCGLAHL